mmetsp:Transcript_6657/g.9756  ORF Transcript_6657/g.9756 Transcript_6657/m.9756 type:complete len:203 (+) Transcript_6657:254-862(+)
MSLKAKVPIFTPRFSPAVLDPKVSHSRILICTIPNCQHTMVNASISTTAIIREDSGAVELEREGSGIHSNTGWLHDNRGDERMLIPCRKVSITLNLRMRNLGTISTADGIISGKIRILILGAKPILTFLKFKRVLHESPLAGTISRIAIHDVLFGKRNEFASFDKVGSFNGTGAGECPAGSAVSLVFDGGHSSSCHPVDFIG